MIDFTKLYCDCHPSELITNFCLKCNDLVLSIFRNLSNGLMCNMYLYTY